MVCKDCEKKLSKVIVPDKWKDGARNVTGGTDGGRATTYRNSLLQVRGATQRFQAGVKTCRICKSKVSQDANYCQECAHHNGICAMCGKRVDDLRFDRRGGVKPEKRKEPQGFVESDYGTAERFRKKAKAPEESEEAPPSVPQEDPEVVARRERDARAQASALGAADAALNRARNRVVGAEPAAAAPAPAPAPAGRGRGATTPAWMSQAPAPAANAYGDWQSARDATSGKVYYYNAKTQQTSWTWPPAAAPPPAPPPQQQRKRPVNPLAAGAAPPTLSADRMALRDETLGVAGEMLPQSRGDRDWRSKYDIGGGLEGRDNF